MSYCVTLLADSIIMYKLNLPPFEPIVTTTDGHMAIFDTLRRKYVALTPEEWVRQHFVNYLISHKGYPKAYVANEVELRIGSKRLRCDSVVYDASLSPRMIIEYKAPTIALQQRVFDQMSAYNQLLHVDYLIASNGLEHICCKMDYASRSYHFLKDIPDYNRLCPPQGKRG